MFHIVWSILFLSLSLVSCSQSGEVLPFISVDHTIDDTVVIPVITFSPYSNFLKDQFYYFHKKAGYEHYKTISLYNSLSLLIQTYRSYIKAIELHSDPFEVYILLYSGDRVFFTDSDRSLFFYAYPSTQGLYRHNSRIRAKSFVFYDCIYGKNRGEVEAHLKKIPIFKRKLYFNTENNAAKSIENVVNQIVEVAKQDKAIAQWIKSIRKIYTYNPRNIAEAEVKSMHSYGIALDFRFYREKGYVYWLWSSIFDPEWWDIPMKKRYQMPDKVISIFESNGFVWGGKWRKFDTMHFEYRPEIILWNKDRF